MNSTPPRSITPVRHRAPAASTAEQNPLLLVHRLLRGRYILAAVLAGVLGLAGAAVGFKIMPPQYESAALIRIAPVVPKILFESESNSMMPMFDAFIQTQIALAQSHRVIALALASDTWKAVDTGEEPISPTSFLNGLSVSHPKDSQLIRIGYTSGDADTSRAAVEAVMKAYLTVYKETDLTSGLDRMEVLVERTQQLNADADRLRNDILQIANEFGSDDLDEMHAFKVERVQNLETELEAAKLEFASLEHDAAQTGESEESPVDTSGLTPERIATLDEHMRGLLTTRDEIQTQIKQLTVTWEEPERRPEYRLLQSRHEENQAAIERYAAEFREAYADGTARSAAGILAALNPEEARQAAEAKVERLQTLYETAKAETVDLGRKNLQIHKLKDELEGARERLEQTNARIEQLNLEGHVGGRVSIWSEPEVPEKPINQKRFKQLAILGGFGGAGAGVALVVLLGLRNPRLRDLSDAKRVPPQLLGVVPELPQKLHETTDAIIAAQCVHQIRVMLQTRHAANGPLVLTVTSSASGSGKTSLALSLALSFASVGVRTVVLDGDFTGRGLTRRTGIKPNRKNERRPFRTVDPELSNEAANLPPEEGFSDVGDLDRITDHGDLDRITDHGETALVVQNSSTYGICDALRGERIERCIVNLGPRNLDLLPSSETRIMHGQEISPASGRDLIERLKETYEVVLIDSGPVPGSTDASVMSACADEVLFVVSKGDLERDVRQALQHIELINASLAGLVFNRANNKDLDESGSRSKSSAHVRDAAASKAHTRAMTEKLKFYERYGVLAQAVWATADLEPPAAA